jgi:hypothetical protein
VIGYSLRGATRFKRIASRQALQAAVFALVAAFYYYLTWGDSPVGMVADDAVYLLMADHFSPYAPALRDSAAFITQNSSFPPLYPLLLALFGASSAAIAWAHAVMSTFLIVAIGVCCLWISRETQRWTSGLALALVFAPLPGTVRFSLDLWSEHLYLLVTMTTLYFAVRTDPSPRHWLIAAIAASAAALTRTVGLSLLVAFYVVLMVRRPRGKLALVGVSVLPLLLWGVLARHQVAQQSYSLIVSSAYSNHPITQALVIAKRNAVGLFHGLADDLVGPSSHFGTSLTTGFAALWAVGCLQRLRKLELDAVYVGLYLTVILLWPNPYHAARFLYPLLPVALFQGFAVVQWFAASLKRTPIRAMVRGSYPVALAIALLPTLLLTAQRFYQPREPQIAAFRRSSVWLMHPDAEVGRHNARILAALAASFKASGAVVNGSDCVFSVHQEMFMFYARRLSFAPPLPGASDADFWKDMRRCGYVYVNWTNSHPFYPPGYPQKRLGKEECIFKTAEDAGTSPGKIGCLVAVPNRPPARAR